MKTVDNWPFLLRVFYYILVLPPAIILSSVWKLLRSVFRFISFFFFRARIQKSFDQGRFLLSQDAYNDASDYFGYVIYNTPAILRRRFEIFVDSLMYMSLIHRTSGNLKQAEQFLDEAKFFVKEGTNGYLLWNFFAGNLYADLGKNDLAEKYYMVAYDYCRTNNLSDDETILNLYLSIHSFYLETEAYEKASEFLSKHEANTNFLIHSSIDSLKIAISNKRYESAGAIQSEILRSFYGSCSQRQSIEIEYNLALLALLKGDYKSAFAWGEKAVKNIEQVGDFSSVMTADTLLIFARAIIETGNPLNAKQYVTKAVSIIDKTFSTASVLSIAFHTQLVQLYTHYNDTASFEAEFINLTRQFSAFFFNTVHIMSVEERTYLIKQLYPSYINIMSIIASECTSPGLISASLDFRFNTKTALNSRVNSAESQTNTIAQLRGVLLPHEVAIEVVRQSEVNDTGELEITYLFFIIHPGAYTHPELLKIKMTSNSESAYFDHYHKKISSGSLDMDSYDHLWNPVAVAVSAYKTIYFSPDGLYRQINVESLFTQSGNYLLEEHDFVYCNNLLNIASLEKDRKGIPTNALILSNPVFYEDNVNDSSLKNKDFLPTLEYSKVEGANIEKVLNNNGIEVHHLSEKDVTIQAFEGIYKYELIHIATHGFYRTTVPKNEDIQNFIFSSGLYLSHPFKLSYPHEIQHNPEGYLTSVDLGEYNSDNLILVTLSACNSSRGWLASTGEYFGVQRAFFNIGAKFVLSSQWDIEDQYTSEFMTDFYHSWLEEKDIINAFKKSQERMKMQYPHPSDWASFVLYHR